MPSPRSLDLLVRAARLYYEEGRSQQEVAGLLGLSGSSVSRVLAAAREQGIVHITVHDPRQVVRREPDLETALVARFGLAQAWVATVPDGVLPIDATAILAARLFAERVDDLRRVGLSWGTAVGRFVEMVDLPPGRRDLELFPLVGGMAALDTGPDGSSSLQALAAKCGGRAYRLEAPAVVESSATCAALLQESVIAHALQRAGRVDTAFVGIGTVDDRSTSRVLSAMKLTTAERRRVEAAAPAGDLCGRFVDDLGRPLGPPTATRVIGITLDQLERIPSVVAIAAGVYKTRGVRAALRSGVVKTLVVDSQLAAEILATELLSRTDGAVVGRHR